MRMVCNEQILVHSVFMTMILFVGLPLGYGLIFNKKHFHHKIAQCCNVLVIFAFGLYAHIMFSSGDSIHSHIGKALICTLFIQTLLPLIGYGLLHRIIGKFVILPILFPTQWYFGLIHVIVRPNAAYTEITGHLAVGLFFSYFGLLSLWNSDTKNKIRFMINIETIFVPFASMMHAGGEIYNQLDYFDEHKDFPEGVYHHVTIDILLLSCGCLCILYYLLFHRDHNETRILLHNATLAFSGLIMGFVLFNHAKEDDAETRIIMHKLCGIIIIIGSIFKLLKEYLLTGIASIFCGICFIGSGDTPNNKWMETGYPMIIYIVIVLFIAFYVSIINLILYFIWKFNDISIEKSTSEGSFREELSGNYGDGDGDCESVPFLN